MKTKYIIITILLALMITATTQANAFSAKGDHALGVMGLGYYELNTDWESLYFGSRGINGSSQTGGFGFGAFFEFGVADRVSMEIDLAYNRLVYASLQRSLAKENYFTADVLGHFYFIDNETFNPYLIVGLGTVISSGSTAPVGDVGFGVHFRLAKEFSIKTEILFKSAVILNRGEGRVGVAYHF